MTAPSRRDAARDLLRLLDLKPSGELVHIIDDAEVRQAWARLLSRLGFLRHEATK